MKVNRILKYFTWISVICFFVSFVSIFTSGFFLRLIKIIPLQFWIGLSFVISCLMYGCSVYFKYYKYIGFYKIEFLLGLACIFFYLVLIGINEYDVDSKALNIAAVCWYGIIGYILKSHITWTLCLISLGTLFSVISGYFNGDYFIAMDEPKFVCLLGIILILITFVKELLPNNLLTLTKAFGCLYFFISVWILSIWDEHYLIWNFVYISSSILIMCIGLTKKNNLFSRFGLVFFLIDVYTLYFQHFWNVKYKSSFFFVLGLSFAGVGFYGKYLLKFFVKK